MNLTMRLLLACMMLTPFWPSTALAQTEVLGCTNPLALNLDPADTKDYGTCLGTGCPAPAVVELQSRRRL